MLFRSQGPAAAPPSRTRFYLARARVHRPRDRVLGDRFVRRLPSHAISRHSTVGWVPSSVSPGLYHLIACADAGHVVRESNEANNCRVSARVVRVKTLGDHTPPTFAGLRSATTCTPGPVEPGAVRYHLVWDAAVDDRTPSTKIAYDVYQATEPGGENFADPSYTTVAGATAATTPPLPNPQTYYFVVRARDRAGNRDSNRVERMGVNPCE